jgi:radical SAM superfamily enzyme YgiQ (UPF0313 family)
MKVLLIEPPYERFVGFRSEWYPMGLTSIATYLAGMGYDARVYHAEHGHDTAYTSVVRYSQQFNRYKAAIEDDTHPVWQEIKTEIARFIPDVVGLSVATPKVPSAFKIANIVKSICPSAKIIVGGQHPTLLPEEMFTCPEIDFVIRGEGEETVGELINVFGLGDADYSSIQGISFVRNGKIVHTPERKLLNQLDSLPFPDRERLLYLDTFTPVQLSMVMTSRGCPYRCGFCSSQNMWTRKVRFFSINRVMQEIKYLKENYGVKNITFMDDSFTINKKRVIDFCTALLDEHMDITWSCLTRVNIIDDDIIRVMKTSGCTKVDIGIESGNQRVLDLIRKDIALDEVRQAVRVLHENNMFWAGFFMFGFPTETEQEVLDTLDFMKELRPDWANISIFTPYPGSFLFDLAQHKGMIPEKPDYTLYSHQNIGSRCTDTIPPENFKQLALKMFRAVHIYNSSYRRLLKRALTRGYLKNPKLLFLDMQKAIVWLKK